ncbi:pyruvate dehydrogenase complex dihydrolipoamide acetyltransferase [Flavobacteriales bacterium]|jgi:pyruvate dehydrogenase E2 component (dihydrolipoamide acetyltransferase)|nr:pyruvate dehydrogenase complex dihydrolipoamide acetyltransferase [Flavobacteriales bacterium]
MAEIVRMPKLSDTMTEGVVAEWHKKVGDPVESGEVLAEIETDKATMEFESFQDGVLLHIGVDKGATAAVDSILAILGEAGEDVSSLLTAEAEAPVEAAAPTPTPAPAPAPVAPVPAPAAPAPAPVAVAAPAAAPAVPLPSSNGKVKASPLAARLAAERSIDLGRVTGTGEGGRIVKRDIEAYVPAAAAGLGAVESSTDTPVSQMRKTIARRLAESKFTAPHFYLKLSVEMDAAVEARKAINAQEGVKVSFNDMVVKAVSLALKKHPAVNSAWMDTFIRTNEHVHIGVAVAVEDGLLVPVVRHADRKSLTEIGAEVKDYAGKARDKKLQPSDWEGNTFTISNLGMFGIEDFTAIINPPDACILAVGGISDVPVVRDGAVVPGKIMKLTLSCDHRAVDGATGAAFLQEVKSLLEHPVRMLA